MTRLIHEQGALGGSPKSNSADTCSAISVYSECSVGTSVCFVG